VASLSVPPGCISLFDYRHSSVQRSKFTSNKYVPKRKHLNCTFRLLQKLTHEGVYKSFRTESITKYTLTTINTRWGATQRAVAAELTTLTHKMAIQLHLVTENCIICSSRSRRPVRKLLDALSYTTNLAFWLPQSPLTKAVFVVE
jgi:hypothetical protein